MGDTKSGQPAGATDELDIPNVQVGSKASGGEPSSSGAPKFDKAALEELAGSLTPLLETRLRESLKPDVKKEVQSVKDSRWAETYEKIKNLDFEAIQAVGELLKAKGGDAAAVEQDLAIQEVLKSRRQGQAPELTQQITSQQISGMSKEEMKAAIVKALEPFKLPKETAQAALDEWGKGKSYSDLPTALATLNAIVASKQSALATPPPATGAGAIPPAGGTIGSMSDADRETVKADLRLKLTGQYFKNPSKYAKEIKDAKAKLKELGEPEFGVSS